MHTYDYCGNLANELFAVRRHSQEVGTFENRFWRSYRAGEPERFLKAALLLEDQRRRDRRQRRSQHLPASMAPASEIPMPPSATRIYRELCHMTRNFRGKVFPSYDHLAQATGLGRATIARGIARLTKLGFLSVQRRCKRLPLNGPGPRFAQASNAYRIELPRAAAALLPRTQHPAPLPCDDLHRRALEMVERRRMLNPWSVEGGLHVGDASLALALNRLAALITARESQNDAEPSSQSIYTTEALTFAGRPPFSAAQNPDP